MDTIRQNFETGGAMGIVGFIPWLKDLLPRSWLGIDAMEASIATVHGYFEVNAFKCNSSALYNLLHYFFYLYTDNCKRAPRKFQSR